MNPPIRSPLDELGLNLTRRRFFEQGSHVLGGAALASLLPGGLLRRLVRHSQTPKTIQT